MNRYHLNSIHTSCFGMSLLDKDTAVKERFITVRPSVPWYTAEVTAKNQKQRRLQRKWRAVCTSL